MSHKNDELDYAQHEFLAALRGMPLARLKIATKFQPNPKVAREHPEVAALFDEFDFFDIDMESVVSDALTSITSLTFLQVQIEEPPALTWRAQDNKVCIVPGGLLD